MSDFNPSFADAALAEKIHFINLTTNVISNARRYVYVYNRIVAD